MNEWIDYLKKELGKMNSDVPTYLRWANEKFRKPPVDASLSALAKSLASANWRRSNDSTYHINHVIADYVYCPGPVQALGWRSDRFEYGLKVGGRPLRPPKADLALARAYGVDLISPWLVFGIRYTPLDNGEKRDLLVSPLGRIFFRAVASDNGEWQGSELALVADIQQDGTAGNFLIVSTYWDDNESWHDESDDFTRTYPPDLPTFTVAQLDKTVGLVPESPGTETDISEKLKVESTLKILMVETGAKLTGVPMEGLMPTAMYPLQMKSAKKRKCENNGLGD